MSKTSGQPRYFIRRIVILYILVCGAATLAVGESTYLIARHRLERDLTLRMTERMRDLQEIDRKEGRLKMMRAMAKFAHAGGHFTYSLRTSDGKAIVGMDRVI